MGIPRSAVILLQDGRFFPGNSFGAEAAVRAIRLAGQKISVRSIQEYHS